MNSFVWLLLKWAPKNAVSFLLGRLSRIPWGAWAVRAFANAFAIDWNEAEKPLSEYRTIHELFTRKVRPRAIASAEYVHPVDGVLTEAGVVENNQLVQVKGMTYSLSELVNREDSFGRGYFLTYYLSPKDYHRVHFPFACEVSEVSYIPGDLWPVNQYSVKRVKNLFARNERIVIKTVVNRKVAYIVMVGATNVGHMTLSFEPAHATNDSHFRKLEVITYKEPKPFKPGDELGIFHLGSTVIVVFEETPGFATESFLAPIPVRFGEKP